MLLRPARLEPQFVPRIWGSRNLAPLFPEKQELREPVGEVWLTGNECRFANGPFAGERLGEVWPRMDHDWAGAHARSGKPFPILAKFLFPEDKLSVQVHPDDDYAKRSESESGGVGKTEMWYVVSARPGAEVRVGLKPHVHADLFRKAIANNNAEDLLGHVPVRSGDAIFVPAGTVHTIGPGMVLCEIQQNSDLTYRVFDFHRLGPDGKPRDLHIEKAFDVIKFGEQHAGKVRPQRQKDEKGEISVLMECPYFAVVKHTFRETQCFVKPKSRLEIVVILEGAGVLRTQPGDAVVEYSRAQTWLIPSALQERAYEPTAATTMLCVSVPEA